MKKYINQKGVTLIEIIIVIAVTSVIATVTTFSVLKFRDSIQYDILLNSLVESTDSAKMKAVTSKLDNGGSRISYGVRFFDDRFVEFEGELYVEGAGTNTEYQLPVGLHLSSTCLPIDNGTVVFSPILGENNNNCTIYIYRMEQVTPIGSVIINKFGVQHAS
jgi:prepilin-type N-terminal cleavage/methylation domain-containing protein